MNFDLEQKHIIFAAGILLIAGVAALNYNSSESGGGNTEIVATFYPLYDVTGEIAGDTAEVSSLVPPGTDPHNFELSPRDVEKANNAEVLVINGAGFEAWESELVEEVDSDVTVVNASKGIELKETDESPHDHDENQGEEEGNDEHEGEHNETHEENESSEEEHDHGSYDPHYWLSPVNAQIIAENVAEGLEDADQENSEEYSENQDAYISELEELDAEYEEGLEQCDKSTILTSHAAFTYMGDEYGFDQVPITGVSHLSEPSSGELERLSEEAEKHDLEYIFHDSMVDSSTADTIAEEVGAEVLVIDVVAGADERPYTTIMRENLDNLETAMQCQ